MAAESVRPLPSNPVARGTSRQARRFWIGLHGDRNTKGTMTNISDIRTRIESGADEQSFLATKTEATPVLTLVDTAERSDPRDPLIQALMGKLPKPNTVWSLEDRTKWLRAA